MIVIRVVIWCLIIGISISSSVMIISIIVVNISIMLVMCEWLVVLMWFISGLFSYVSVSVSMNGVRIGVSSYII